MKNGNSKRNIPDHSYSPFSLRNTQSTGIISNKSNPKKKIVIKKSIPVNKQKIKEKESEKEKVKEKEKIILKEKDKIKEKQNQKKMISDDNSNNIISPDIFKDTILNTKSNLNTIPISFGKDDLLPKEFFQDDIVSGSSFIISDIQMPNIKVENKISIPIQNLINELIQYENIRNTIMNCISRKRICLKTGKIIFNTFRDELYNNEFLFYYSNHRCSRIICKPIIIFHNKKLHKSKSQIYENNSGKKTASKLLDKEINIQSPRKIQELKINLNLKNNEEQNNINNAVPSLLDTSTITNAIAKDLNDNMTTVKIEKRQSLFPTNNSTFHLTKIPQKTQENTENVRLNIAYNKAKDAARVVRRLEYSYSMRISILLSKPVFQKNARIIQNWWRTLMFIKKNKGKIINFQRYYRGHLARKAFGDSMKLYFKIMPFIRTVDKIISRKCCQFVFNVLVPNFAMLKNYNLMKPRIDKINYYLRKFAKNQQYIREIKTVSKKFIRRCQFTKQSVQFDINLKIKKIQSNFRRFLMHNNDKIMLNYSNVFHPYLYYKLKYKDEKYKKKINGLNKCLKKLKELNLKANKKIGNKYEYLGYLLKKILFNRLKLAYKKSLQEKNAKKLRKILLKKIINKYNNKKKDRNLKNYFHKWKNYTHYYNNYLKNKICDKLKIIEIIMKYNKKFNEKLFMLLLNLKSKEEKKKKENLKKNLTKLFKIYSKRNDKEFYKNILNKYFKKWEAKAQKRKVLKATNLINKNSKIYLKNKNEKKKNRLLKIFNMNQHILRNYLNKWKHVNKQFQLDAHNFFNLTKKKVLINKRKRYLKNSFQSLEKREKILLKNKFIQLKINTGMNYRKIYLSNTQISFLNKNKKYLANKKYRMLKYLINKINNEKRIGRWDKVLEECFYYWKSFGKLAQFKRLIGTKIKFLCNLNKILIKQKLLRWYRKIKNIKIYMAIWLIQRKYHSYKRKKSNKIKNKKN